MFFYFKIKTPEIVLRTSLASVVFCRSRRFFSRFFTHFLRTFAMELYETSWRCMNFKKPKVLDNAGFQSFSRRYVGIYETGQIPTIPNFIYLSSPLTVR